LITVSKLNESWIHIEGDYGDLLSLSEHFAKYTENFKFTPQFKAGMWDGKIRFFNMMTGNLPYGLFSKLEEAIDIYRLDATIDPNILIDAYPKEIDEKIWQTVLDEFKIYDPHEHQIQGARQLIINRKGLLLHATSSGKTVTLFLYLKYMLKVLERFIPRLKIMVVVPRKGLVVQFCKDFETYGMDPILVGKYFGDEKDLSKPITVGTWQSLIKAEEYLSTVNMALADEVHLAKAVSIKTLLEKCNRAKIRVGVTGSLPKPECDMLSIEGSFSRILHEVKTDELIKKGIISKVDVVQIHFNYPRGTQASCKKDYRKEKEIIQSSPERLAMVSTLIGRHRDGENLLLIFDELEFGTHYFEALRQRHPDRHFKYVAGDVSVKEREEIRQFTSENSNVVIVASIGTFSTGINIPRIHAIIGLWLGKSEITLKQTIGRGLRLHESKSRCIFYDIVDQLSYSKKHGTSRLMVYFQEGFPVKNVEVNS